MRHFLITRFNDYFPTFDNFHETSKNHHLGIEEDWLRERISLFFENTVPSVAAQTDKDFTWIIKCHPKTPQWARDLLKRDEFIPVYDQSDHGELNLMNYTSSVFAAAIRKFTDDKEIITTRLDSDDAISKDHIRLVKKHIKINRFYDFARGIVKSRKGIFVHWKPRTSQFCSYLEYGTDLKTVYHKAHQTIEPETVVKNLVDLGWMQNIHEINITYSIGYNKEYPHRASEVDYEVLKDAYPFMHRSWLKLEKARFL